MNLSEFEGLKSSAEVAVSLLKRMAHKDRFLILCHLSRGEVSAGELANRSLLSQSAFSQHLAILRTESLVKTRKKSQTIYYSLANDAVLQVLATLQRIYAKEYSGDPE